MITSLQNRRVKDAARLRSGRGRRQQGRIIIDGARELRRAVRAGVDVREVFLCEETASSAGACELLAKLLTDLRSEHPRVDILHTNRAVLEKLAFGARAEGIVGVAVTPATDLADLQLPADPLVAVLEGVEKPGNVGAVLRSADAAGASALIVANGGTDLFNPNCIRASMGTIFTVPVCQATTSAVIAWLADHSLAVYAARVDAAAAYLDVDYRGPSAIVLGSEAAGLSPDWDTAGVTAVRLPMRGDVDSLNVSAAAAVLFYEALRQRDPR